jgi:O-antigen/teichoic acid export membrane protein
MALSDLLRRVLMARHRQRLDLLLTLSATGATLVMIALVAAKTGVLGTAAAVLAGEVVLLLLAKQALDRTGPPFSLARSLAPSAFAAAAVGLAAFVLREQPLWISLVAAGAVYAACLWSQRVRILADIRRLDAREADVSPAAAGDTR